ncbi:MAG: hypothetical protein ACI9FD_003899 [Gammaproteobacteria bacterium]|jgi:hypothetical protein
MKIKRDSVFKLILLVMSGVWILFDIIIVNEQLPIDTIKVVGLFLGIGGMGLALIWIAGLVIITTKCGSLKS